MYQNCYNECGFGGGNGLETKTKPVNKYLNLGSLQWVENIFSIFCKDLKFLIEAFQNFIEMIFWITERKIDRLFLDGLGHDRGTELL